MTREQERIIKRSRKIAAQVEGLPIDACGIIYSSLWRSSDIEDQMWAHATGHRFWSAVFNARRPENVAARRFMLFQGALQDQAFLRLR